jgi:hypothetical protein
MFLSRRATLKMAIGGVTALSYGACRRASAAPAKSPAIPQSPKVVSLSADSSQFVQIRDGHFMLDGRPFVLKGTNYFGSWRHPGTIPMGPDIAADTIWSLYHDWNISDVAADFDFLRAQLNATAVRIGTPAKSEFAALVKYHGYEPWYNPDGSITDSYRAELVQLADTALENGIRIQFCLLWNVGNEIEADGDAFRPGAPMDRFYSQQVRSIALALRDHPGVIGYSVGNEVLVRWKINGTHTSWYEPRAAGFILSRIRDLRAAAPHQLVTTDENTAHSADLWHSPGPEFALLPDVDGRNGGQAFRLLDQVDYLSAHFYPETLTEEDVAQGADFKIGDALDQLGSYLRAAKAAGKPVSFGEFGLKMQLETLTPAQYSGFRDRLFQRVLAAGPGLGLQGLLAWLALPEMVLRPGQYAVASSKLNPFSPIEVDMKEPGGNLEHVLFLNPSFSLFTWGTGGDTPYPTEAAKALAGAWQR